MKQKFLDRLFAGRSKSKAINTSPKNGIVKKSSKAGKLKTLGDNNDSHDAKLNGNDNCSPNSEHVCPDTSQNDSDENTIIKSGGIYSLEKLRCLESTGSTYLSLQGIVKQRRLQFQKCVDEGTNVNVEDDSESRSFPSSPQCRSKGLPASVDRHLSHQYSPLMQIRGNCYKFVHDESFSTSVMSMGYVRALATKLNSDSQIQEKPISEKEKLDDDVFTNNNKHILSSSPKSSSSPASNSPVLRRRKSSETGSPWIVRTSFKGKDKKSVLEQIRYIESRNSRSVNVRSRHGSRSRPAHHSPRPKRQSEIEDLFDSSWSDDSDQDQSFESEDSDLDAKRDLVSCC